ncbi:cupin domain-containing protein [Candidatus Altiarchaeota archaeon]
MISKPRIVDKPWGRELWLAHEQEYALKILEVKKGERLSLQYHKEKKESIYVYKGKMRLVLGEEEMEMCEGDVVTVEPGVKHRMRALDDLVLIEASTPQLDDVVRIEDDYNRA